MRPTAHREECKADGSPSWAGQPGWQAIIKNFLVAQRVKRLSATQETWVLSLSWEDPLEKGMATHSRTLAWKTPWTEEPGGLQRVGHDFSEWTTTIVNLQCCVSFRYTEKWFSYIDRLFQILFHCSLLHDIEYNSLCYTVGPCYPLVTVSLLWVFSVL